MALTPEDVVNKRFNSTKFREGYDQDEVDDFLDEVVVELRRLNQENEELRQRLMASEARIAELQRAGAGQVVPAQPVQSAQPEAYAAPYDPSMDPNNTNNLLQLARRLHEEHVREGIEKRDALIAEGHATAARVVSEAEAAHRAQLGALQAERNELERRIEELRGFEREYRAKLKSYIEGQLRELENTSALTAGPPTPAPQAVTAAPQPQGVLNSGSTGPAYPAPQPPEYASYPQPTEYPGFGSGN